jgi:hypothetical protein
MLHDWNSLLVWYWRIYLININPKINRLILVAAFPLDNLDLILKAENGSGTMTISIARIVHYGGISFSLDIIITIFGQNVGIIVLLVNKLTHVDLWLSTNIVELFCSWIGLHLVLRSTRRIPLWCNHFWLLWNLDFFLGRLAQRLVGSPVRDYSSFRLTLFHLFLVCHT